MTSIPDTHQNTAAGLQSTTFLNHHARVVFVVVAVAQNSFGFVIVYLCITPSES